MPSIISKGGSIEQCGVGEPSEQQMRILQKVANRLGGRLVVDQVGYQGDPSWVKFRLKGLVDSFVMMMLNSAGNELFEGTNMEEWQILKSSNQAEDWGMWLHHLADPKSKSECRPGVWYY